MSYDIDSAILKLLQERYFLKNETTWEELAKRVSSIHSPIYEYVKDKKDMLKNIKHIEQNTTNSHQAGVDYT